MDKSAVLRAFEEWMDKTGYQDFTIEDRTSILKPSDFFKVFTGKKSV